MADAQQLRMFNADNPPQAWSKEEGNAKLETIKAELRANQMQRITMHNALKRGGNDAGS